MPQVVQTQSRSARSFALNIGALVLGIAIIAAVNARAVDVPDVTDKAALVPPPEHMEHFTLGYNENFSDSLWLRVIQDIDYCDTSQGSATEMMKMREPGKKPEFCHAHLGWTYRMIDAITTLTPKFRMPYNHGATIMSITVGDKEGARRIFERGIENFPTDWSLQFRAAYHYLYELQQPKRAADLLVMAGKNGAPQWVYALAAKTYTAEGQALLAKSVLQSVLEEDPDSKYSGRLKERLDQVEETLRKESQKSNP